CNFPPPTADSPSLLTATQLKTLFHELGHGLHGLLSQAQYPYLSGTSVTRDYVEFPSQMMENWGRNAEVIKGFARHYQSGEVIPDGLLIKLKEASTFNMGFVTTEYIAASYLDMSWHMLESIPEDPQAFERETLGVLGLIPEIASRYRTTYFAHIFAGGYCAGYYSYIWSEVLDSDAFSLFEERGLFDQKTSDDLLQFVYSAGNTADVLTQYVRFRGSEPKIDALLRNRGLSEASLQ
ncbi:MAG: M3 family metallopeptidase, partial [Myxococcota bacterium]|nr:M3 family metallopeptidase [Myxococcota bacterium]